jgi:uncharacterized protein YfkK (UPF0435 family)
MAKRYARYFWAEPEDVTQMIYQVVARRPSFGPDDNVVWLAQDALHNLVQNRKRSPEYRRLRHFSHETTTPLPDDAENEWIDEDDVVFADENVHATPRPNPEQAVLEKERVETLRTFLAELKESLDPVERTVLEAGETDSYDTTELQRKLRCTRERIYVARRTIKDQAQKLRQRWEAAGRSLPGFRFSAKKTSR